MCLYDEFYKIVDVYIMILWNHFTFLTQGYLGH